VDFSGFLHKKCSHDIAEILLKVTLSTINLNQSSKYGKNTKMLINALEKESKNHHFLKFNDDKNYEFLISLECLNLGVRYLPSYVEA
jgi:hypothetical protein